ncbi:MAG: class I tRNA ligase family protein, partial [Cyclobacteriaceae bacterium]
TPEQKAEVEAYVNEAVNRSERERMSDVKKVTGVFTGAYAINPFSNERIPIWTADYVLAGYGTGAVMAVPAHDERDHRFAKQFGLKITQVIAGDKDVQEEPFTSKDAEVINSDFLNGLKVKDAIEKAIAFAEEKGFGKAKVNFRLRDAIFGRQRYWGEPIPVYYKDGVPHLVEDDKLPLNLPEVSEYLPTEDGDPPLGRAKDWNHDGHSYELSTMPGWAGSSWYFFRYMDPKNEDEFCSQEALDYWGEVDFYLGGSEHATGHLLYSRFWTKFLYDRGYVKVEEYAKKLVNQGMIQGISSKVYELIWNPYSELRDRIARIFMSADLVNSQDNELLKEKLTHIISEIEEELGTSLDSSVLNAIAWTVHNIDISFADWTSQKNGWVKLDIQKALKNDRRFNNVKLAMNDDFWAFIEIEKMSKSKFNVVNPDDLVQHYGADTLRMYEMFLGPIEQSKPWNTNGIDGVFKFLRKFWNLFHDGDSFTVSDDEPTKEEMKILHGLIKKVQDDCESLSLNTSISAFMIATNELGALKCNKRTILEPITILLAPFAPHISEELYHKLGNETSVVDATFPVFEAKHLVEDSFEYPISINGKTRTKLSFPTDASKEDIEAQVLTDEIVMKWTEGKPPKKVIVVPKRIVNVVV